MNYENDLKCCGNCLHGVETDEACGQGKDTVSFEYCNEWKYDGLTLEERMVTDYTGEMK